MDLRGIVDHESLFPLELRHPITGVALGIIFNLRSVGSEASKRVIREHADEAIRMHHHSTPITADKIERRELDKAVAYVASWEWGEHTYEGVVNPECSPENVRRILDAEPWIFAQVVEAATSMENFSKG